MNSIISGGEKYWEAKQEVIAGCHCTGRGEERARWGRDVIRGKLVSE